MRRPSKGLRLLALGVGGSYLVVSALWILLSDHVAAAFAPTPEALALIQTWKGLWFVSASSVVIAAIIWIYGYRREQVQSRLELVFESVSDAFAILDHDWRIRYANPKAVQVSPFGKRMIGMNFWAAYPEIIGTKFETAYRKAMTERVEVTAQDLLLGMNIWFEAKGVPVPEGLAMFGRDISEQKLAEIARAESEERLHRFLDNSPMAAWITDSMGRIQWVSRGFHAETVDGRNPIGRTIGELFGEQSARAITGPLNLGHAGAVPQAPVVTVEPLLRPSGEAGHYLVHRFALGGSSASIGFIAVDITDRIRAERLLVEAGGGVGSTAARLQDELDAFVHAVSHDLRAPLRSITGFTDALVEEYAEQFDADGRRYLKFLHDAADRMGGLIEGLLELSRISRVDINHGTVDIAQLVRERVAALRVRDPDREVVAEIPDSVRVTGDLRLLRLAMSHLVDNAWKFTAGRHPARITLSQERQGNRQVVLLSDNGVGFNMAHVNKLFTPFQRLHGIDEFEGLGIGLVVVQRIIRRHGGRIWVDAAVGEGASVRFVLETGQ